MIFIWYGSDTDWTFNFILGFIPTWKFLPVQTSRKNEGQAKVDLHEKEVLHYQNLQKNERPSPALKETRPTPPDSWGYKLPPPGGGTRFDPSHFPWWSILTFCKPFISPLGAMAPSPPLDLPLPVCMFALSLPASSAICLPSECLPVQTISTVCLLALYFLSRFIGWKYAASLSGAWLLFVGYLSSYLLSAVCLSARHRLCSRTKHLTYVSFIYSCEPVK